LGWAIGPRPADGGRQGREIEPDEHRVEPFEIARLWLFPRCDYASGSLGR
jgi:hypothetical protein